MNLIPKQEKMYQKLGKTLADRNTQGQTYTFPTTKRLDCVWMIEMIIIVFLVGIIIFQELKIKELNQEIYAAKRYIQFIEKGNKK